jgi:hypothetical protein
MLAVLGVSRHLTARATCSNEHFVHLGERLRKSEQSRRMAWQVLQEIRQVLEILGDQRIPSASHNCASAWRCWSPCETQVQDWICSVSTGSLTPFIRLNLRASDGIDHQPFDCRSPWRAVVGGRKCAARRGLSVHVASSYRRPDPNRRVAERHCLPRWLLHKSGTRAQAKGAGVDRLGQTIRGLDRSSEKAI